MYMHIVVVCIMREGKRERERQTEKDRGRERNHKNCIVDWQLSTHRINTKYALMNYDTPK